MTNETSRALKFGGWGVAIGAVIAIIVGFSWGGWMTAGTAGKLSEETLLASQAAICVAQFATTPNHDRQLKAYQKTDSWGRHEFIGKGGWDKMPGQKEANGAVAQACVNGIDALAAK